MYSFTVEFIFSHYLFTLICNRMVIIETVILSNFQLIDFKTCQQLQVLLNNTYSFIAEVIFFALLVHAYMQQMVIVETTI